MSKHLVEFQDQLLKSKKIVALVGAGLSVSSGLPTFRGSQGLWKNYNQIDLATPDAFYVDPGLVWQFYSWRRFEALKASPNRGHLALSKLSKMSKNCKLENDEVEKLDIEYVTITQNVDSLLTRSGHCKQNLYELHGSLFDLRCTSFVCNYVEHNNFKHPLTSALKDCEYEYDSRPRKRKNDDIVKDEELILSPQFTPVKELDESDLPQCPICKDGSILRPGVVWFGESLPLRIIDKIDNYIELGTPVDLILVIGTSGTVYPANSYVDRIKLKGGKVAVFNTDIEPDILQGKVKNTWGFKGDAAEILPLALKPLIGEL